MRCPTCNGVSILCLTSVFVLGIAGRTLLADERMDDIAKRRQAFLVQLADDWKRVGYPIQWKHDEWKFDEIEPNWSGALAAMRLKRSPEELAKANAFFEAMPLDERIDYDMRVCEVLHTYYLFRDDPDLSVKARRHLLELAHFKPAPRRMNASIWHFGATENHALMGHVWCLLVAQIDQDRETAAQISRHIEAYVVEHIKKGWLEYNSPCYVEKEVGCLLLLAEWAEDPVLRRKAQLGLDVLFAEHAVLNLDGMLGGPACRVYRPGHEGILPEELGHNSRRDARCSGSYPLMYMLFGEGEPHFYGVLGAPLLATSGYVPPAAVSALATAGEERGSYAFKARRPGNGHRSRPPEPASAELTPEMFNARVYAWVTPDFVLGSFQEVQGRYSAARSLPLTSVLRMAGSTRRAVYTNLMLGGREEMAAAVADCFQHKNVSMGRGSVGEAYLATKEFEEVIESDGWILMRAGGTFAAYRVVGVSYKWQQLSGPSLFGDFIKFEKPDAPFILEAARAADYGGDFARFREDVLDNRIEQGNDFVSYESCSQGQSGPSAEAFAMTLRYGQLPLVDGQPVDLEAYPTFESPYLNSAWDSGIVKLRFPGHRLTVNVAKDRSPLRVEETILPLALPYEANGDAPDEAWRPFVNYWRLKPEQWYWDAGGGKGGGCLRHDGALGAASRERGAHDSSILLRGGEAWTDYVFTADAYATKGRLGLWFRGDMHDEGGGNGRWVKGYHFVVDPSRKKCRLTRTRQDGLIPPRAKGADVKPERNEFSNPWVLAEGKAPETTQYEQWMALKVQVCGPSIRCFINDQQVIEIENDMYRSGSVGFMAYKGEDVRLDNIRVVALPSGANASR